MLLRPRQYFLLRCTLGIRLERDEGFGPLAELLVGDGDDGAFEEGGVRD